MRSRPAPRALSGLALIPVLVLAMPGTGLGQVDLSTAVGAFVPLGKVSEVELEGGAFQGDQIMVHEHTPSAAVDARLGFWISDRLALELAGTYAQADLNIGAKLAGATGPMSTRQGEATVVAASARAHFRPAGNQARTAVHLTGGLGFVSRFGAGYFAVEDLTDPAVIVGAGLSVRLTDRVALRWDLEDTISFPGPTTVNVVNLDPSQPGLDEVRTESNARMVNDLVLLQGLSIRL